MTEPPRPPGEGGFGGTPDPTSPPPPPASYSMPGEASSPGYNPPPSGESYPPPGYPPQDGGYPPAGGGYPPPAGGPGYGGPPPPGYANNDEKTWALIAHFGGALGAFISFGPLGFVGPLIAYLAKGQQSPTVRAHALAALNFQILWSAIAFVLLFVSWCLLFIPSLVVFAIQIVFGIIAGMKANDGIVYKYPMSANFIK
ncbi:DUF4870 domain-containing protein [Solwaraspora sp. WMMD406]|uniref:DUF4870 domain-containing protein n=1 Tax=Solwaraspora sp. WMMD406 TaxID=3016095 RepID=UPI002415CEB2|nr:DUF4870 domain-containing protein [Solwaraspora sp. WMMD406]MDG4764838.1 DUF4870 domain-containing protein [Solwaraspora sp. WMMD406]